MRPTAHRNSNLSAQQIDIKLPMRRNFLFIPILLALAAAACRAPQSGVREPPPVAPPPMETAPLPTAAEPTAIIPTETPAPLPPEPPLPTLTPTTAPLRFGVIGDYGQGEQAELDVANLVKNWNPDLIITVGDNNYPVGSPETIDANIGQFYQEYIAPYNGAYGAGAETNRFFPTLGNHDLDTAGGQAYFDYFTLPGNERYYDFVWGPIHFFALNSDSREPDGVGRSSIQAQWLQAGMAASQSPWQVVYFHTAPHSTGVHGPVEWMRWPFAEWGADVVLAGHNHVYERFLIDSIPYFTNGVGGGPIYDFTGSDPQLQARFNDDYGAMLVTADPTRMDFQFITRAGQVIDTYQITKNSP